MCDVGRWHVNAIITARQFVGDFERFVARVTRPDNADATRMHLCAQRIRPRHEKIDVLRTHAFLPPDTATGRFLKFARKSNCVKLEKITQGRTYWLSIDLI